MFNLGEDFKFFHEGEFAIAVVLAEIDWSFEAFDCNLPTIGQIDCVVDAGGHTFSYFLVCFERGMKAQLDDEFSA